MDRGVLNWIWVLKEVSHWGNRYLKNLDPSKQYVIFTDASDQAATAVLTQEYMGKDGDTKEMPVAYLSAQFSNTHFN